jgi:hypothetical protein
MEQECHSLKTNCATLNGTIINGTRFNISKSDLDLLKNISNCNSEKMNLCLTLKNPESESSVHCDKNLTLNIQKDKVGINNPYPLANLDVIGSGIFSQNLSVKRNLNVSGKITGFIVDNNDENSAINTKYLKNYLEEKYDNMRGPKGDTGEKGSTGEKGEPGTAILDGIIDAGSSRLDKFILNSTIVFKGPIVNSYKLIKENTVLENINSPLYIIDNSLKFEIDLLDSTDGMVVKFMNIFINKDVVLNVYLKSSNSTIYNLHKKKVILPTTDVYDNTVFTTINPLSENSSVTLIYLNLTNNPGWYILDQIPVNFYYPENILYDSAGNLLAIQDW